MPKPTNPDVLAIVRRRSPLYGTLIHEIDPTINPVGVEEHMRAEYGTLDHLSREKFAREIRVALACEERYPGYLRMCCIGREAEYDQVQTILDRAAISAAIGGS